MRYQNFFEWPLIWIWVILLALCHRLSHPLSPNITPGMYFVSRKKEFFRDPPVSPVVKIVKVSSIVGYCSTVAWAHFKGHNIPEVVAAGNGNSTIFYINTATNYPYAYNTDDYDEVIAVASKLSDNTLFFSIFFNYLKIMTIKKIK